MVLSDVSRALREEERRAWQRLIRVMGHELNNSLAPIKSIAGSLHARIIGDGIKAEEQQDFERGLGIIESRAARSIVSCRRTGSWRKCRRRHCKVVRSQRSWPGVWLLWKLEFRCK